MDPIANMFSAIKNAQAVNRETVSVPYSKIKIEIAKLIQDKKYIKEVAKRGKKGKKMLELTLSYTNGIPAITDIKRLSKPSRRVYISYKETGMFLKGSHGTLILSTPKGIVDDKTAHKEKVGGEIVGIIW